MAQQQGEKPKREWNVRKSTRLFRFLKPYRLSFGIGFVFLILSSLTAMLFPYFIGKLIGQDEPEAAAEGLLQLESLNDVIIALLVVFTAQAIFSFFRIVIFTKVTENALMDIRTTAFSRLVMLPMDYYNSNKVGELTSRIATDTNQLQTTFTTTLAEFVRQVITIFVGIAALVWLSPKLSLIMLAVIPAVALLAVFFGRYIRKLSKLTQDAAATSNGILEEALQGIQNVKSFTNEWFELKRYTIAVNDIQRLAVKGAIWRGFFVSFIILGLFGSITFIIWQGVLLTQSGDMLQSSFISFIMYTIFLGASIGSLPDLYAGIQKAVGATENLMEIIDMEPEALEQGEPSGKLAQGAAIAFEQVGFHYSSRSDLPVLRDVSFEVQPGEQLAIVGPSGAGKSTITSLLLRFYKPVTGRITLDGKPVDSFALSDYRSRFAIVPQEVLLFNGSIRENIEYGRPGSTDAEIRAAAEQANATEFIDQFPEGLKTLVGERGVQLSGGQRQRIAIARAVLRNPAILILDEATSSLDSASEALVQQALEKLMKGRTSIVIAHRLSTIRKADRIIVLEQGRIAESGTHRELSLSDNGLYNKLQSIQNANA